MKNADKQNKAQAAWDRIEALGGHGVWESEIVIVSLDKTDVTDEDLALFRDFPFVQMLDLSHTRISGEGLARLGDIPALKTLIVTDTKISEEALKEFQHAHPEVKIRSGPPSKGGINPFTRKPL